VLREHLRINAQLDPASAMSTFWKWFQQWYGSKQD